MNYTSENEWAEPYITELHKWIAENGITLQFYKGEKDVTENWIFHPKATEEEFLQMCLRAFSPCHKCKFNNRPHPLIECGSGAWLKLCTIMAISKGIVSANGILSNKTNRA